MLLLQLLTHMDDLLLFSLWYISIYFRDRSVQKKIVFSFPNPFFQSHWLLWRQGNWLSGVCRIQTFRHLEATTWLLSGLSWTGRRCCVMVTENHAHRETCVFAVVFISVWRGRSCQCAEKRRVPALACAATREERMFGLFFPHLWILSHWSR